MIGNPKDQEMVLHTSEALARGLCRSYRMMEPNGYIRVRTATVLIGKDLPVVYEGPWYVINSDIPAEWPSSCRSAKEKGLAK